MNSEMKTPSGSVASNISCGFAPYDRYKNSGIEWLGEVPEHWDVRRNLGVFDERKECNQPEEELLSVTVSRGIIRQSEITSKKDSSNDDKSKYKVVRVGDLAYNKMRAWQGALGISAFNGIVSPAYVVLTPRNQNLSKYFHYLYRTPQFITEANRLSYGLCDDMNSLRYEHFKTSYTPLPPDEEIDRIVAFLDQKTAEIDALIAKKKRQIELLDEQKAILINRAFSRICLKDEDAKFPTVGKLIQKQELTIQDGNHGELHPVSADYVDDGIPFLMASDVRPEEVNLATCAKLPEKKAKKLRIGFALAGDVLLTHKATIGQVGKLPDVLDSPFVMLSPQTTYYRPLLGRIKSGYLFQLLQTNYVQEQLAVLALNQSTRGYVGLIAQKRMTLPIPSHQSQLQFESEARAIQKKTSAVRFRFKSQIEQLQSFRSLIIAHAATGRFRCP